MMNADAMAAAMVNELKAQGFNVTNEHAKTQQMCKALAKAVVEHIQNNAKAMVVGGSSNGPHSIQ